MGDLLRAPRCRPMSVLAAAMTSTTPGADVWARHGRPVLSHHRACEAVLHVAPQPIVRGQLGDRGRLARRALCHCAVDARYARPPHPSRRVATQLSRDSRRGSPEPNVAHPGALSSQDRDLFPLRTGQVASRSGRQADRPAYHRPHGTNGSTHGRRHATGSGSGILTRQPPRDRLPEPLLLLTPRYRRPTRRTHRRPTRPV